MVVPQAVHDATSHHRRATAMKRARTDGWRTAYARAGYQDGTEFDVDHRIAPTEDGGRAAIPERREFAASARIKPAVYEAVQRKLALEPFSNMSAERRQTLDVRMDSDEQLMHVSYPDGAELTLLLCSGQDHYYLLPRVKRPGADAFLDLTERVMHIFTRWLYFDVQGVRYILEIQIAE